MVKKGDYINLHFLYRVDVKHGYKKGIYEVVRVDKMDNVSIDRKLLTKFTPNQYTVIKKNKINKLLFKEIKWVNQKVN